MSDELRPAVSGDVNDVRTLRLDNVQGGDVASVAMIVWRKGVTERLPGEVVEQAGTHLDVSVSLGDASGWLSTALIGQWLAEVEVTYVDGTILTWPGAAPAKIAVRADGD